MTKGEESKQAKIFCNRCRLVTNHLLVGQHQYQEVDPLSEDGDEFIYRLWICAGCEEGTLERGRTFLGEVYEQLDEAGNELWTRDFYPKRSPQDLTEKTFIKLKPKLQRIYRETISCFNGGEAMITASANDAAYWRKFKVSRRAALNCSPRLSTPGTAELG